jgi:hypothetical protein
MCGENNLQPLQCVQQHWRLSSGRWSWAGGPVLAASHSLCTPHQHMVYMQSVGCFHCRQAGRWPSPAAPQCLTIVSLGCVLNLVVCSEGNNYALVDTTSGNTLRTAAGKLHAPYSLMDVIVSCKWSHPGPACGLIIQYGSSTSAGWAASQTPELEGQQQGEAAAVDS